MSKKDALAFLNQIADDKELMLAAKAAGKDKIINVAARAGFCVTLEELKMVSKEIKGIESELSDDQLDVVTGGLSTREISEWAYSNVNKLNSLYKNLF